MNSNPILRLLFVEQTPDKAETLTNILRKGGFATRPELVQSHGEFQDALTEGSWDMVLAAPQVGDLNALQALELINEEQLDLPCIIIADGADEDYTVKALRSGAKDLIPTGRYRQLLHVVTREWENLIDRRCRRGCEIKYNELQRRCSSLLDASNDAVAYITDGMHIHANPVYLEIFGYQDVDELAGLPLMDLIEPEDQGSFKKFLQQLIRSRPSEPQSHKVKGRTADNGAVDLEMTFSMATYDGEDCFQVLVSRRNRPENLDKRLDQASQKDELTGLYNRSHFLSVLAEQVELAAQQALRGHLVYLNIDNFEGIKETVGVANTDAILTEVSNLLSSGRNEDEVLAHFSDSTFTMLLPWADNNRVEQRAQNYCQLISKHIAEVEDQSVALTCSIGIAPVNEWIGSPQEVLDNADTACRTAAREGGNRIKIHKPPRKVRTTVKDDERIDILASNAIEDERLHLIFQPIVQLQGQEREIYEVRLRITDDDGAVVPPRAFFDAAERLGLTSEMDMWVIESTLDQLAEELEDGREPVFFLKISDLHITDETLILNINRLLKARHLPGDNLVFEVSEHTAARQVKFVRAFVNGLHQIQCRSALDHFGTGINSFNTVQHVDVDYVKIDGSYTSNLYKDEKAQTAVRQLNDRAHELGKLTIADTVEDAQSLAQLWQIGVDFVQGAYIQDPGVELGYDFSEFG